MPAYGLHKLPPVLPMLTKSLREGTKKAGTHH